MANKKKKTHRKKVYTLRASEIVAGASIIDGLFGLGNLVDRDFTAMKDELVNSITDPMADGGLVDDLIDTAVNYAVLEGVGRVAGWVSGGKRPGITLGKIRISI